MTRPRDQRVVMTSPSLDHLEGSCACPRDQRVAMTSPSLDHLNGNCACLLDRRVATTTRSPERVWGSVTDPRDQHVTRTSLRFECLEGCGQAVPRVIPGTVALTHPRDQRVSMTSPLSDRLEGICSCPQDQCVSIRYAYLTVSRAPRLSRLSSESLTVGRSRGGPESRPGDAPPCLRNSAHLCIARQCIYLVTAHPRYGQEFSSTGHVCHARPARPGGRSRRRSHLPASAESAESDRSVSPACDHRDQYVCHARPGRPKPPRVTLWNCRSRGCCHGRLHRICSCLSSVLWVGRLSSQRLARLRPSRSTHV